MMHDPIMEQLIEHLDQRAEDNNPAQFWLRDDDAVQPTPALDQLLQICRSYKVPLTLAVIPAFAESALTRQLAKEFEVSVAVHGWAHKNHAPVTEKRQELGLHRPISHICQEISKGYEFLLKQYGKQFVPLLVPPWNRIAPQIADNLPDLGFQALSVFGPEDHSHIHQINSHVDLIDWKGTRGGRSDSVLLNEIIALLKSNNNPIGLLTHHLVHDTAAWSFLQRFLATAATHPGCRWMPITALMPSP